MGHIPSPPCLPLDKTRISRAFRRLAREDALAAVQMIIEDRTGIEPVIVINALAGTSSIPRTNLTPAHIYDALPWSWILMETRLRGVGCARLVTFSSSCLPLASSGVSLPRLFRGILNLVSNTAEPMIQDSPASAGPLLSYLCTQYTSSRLDRGTRVQCSASGTAFAAPSQSRFSCGREISYIVHVNNRQSPRCTKRNPRRSTYSKLEDRIERKLIRGREGG